MIVVVEPITAIPPEEDDSVGWCSQVSATGEPEEELPAPAVLEEEGPAPMARNGVWPLDEPLPMPPEEEDSVPLPAPQDVDGCRPGMYP